MSIPLPYAAQPGLKDGRHISPWRPLPGFEPAAADDSAGPHTSLSIAHPEPLHRSRATAQVVPAGLLTICIRHSGWRPETAPSMTR